MFMGVHVQSNNVLLTTPLPVGQHSIETVRQSKAVHL